MSKLRKNDILIYHADNYYVEHIDNRIEGNFNKLYWADLNKITDAILNLVDTNCGKAEAVSYFTVNGTNKLLIGNRISILPDDVNIDVKPIVTTFLRAITKSDNFSGDLFTQNLSPFDDIIKKEVCDFLLLNGNKPIRQGFEVKTDDILIKMAGRFGQLANREQSLDDPPQVHLALVDGLVKHQRAVHLKLASQKIIVAYFNEIDFPQLHQLMLSEKAQQFTIQNKFDAGGKKDLYLISIEKDSQKFLNI